MNAPPELPVLRSKIERLWRPARLMAIFGLMFLTSCSGADGAPTLNSQTSPTASLETEVSASAQTEPVVSVGNPTHTTTVQNNIEPIGSSYPSFSFNFDYQHFVWVGMGGFAFETVPGYLVEINVTQASVSDQSGRILITMTGSTTQQPEPNEAVLAEFLDVMSANFMDLIISEPAPILIQGDEGLTVEIKGNLSNKIYSGRVVSVLPAANHQFLAQAIGLQNGGTDFWLSPGDPDFKSVLASIQFFEPTDSACMIAAEDDYGYTPENPVRVGSTPEGDSQRAAAFLSNLRGQNFEPAAYRLLHSQDSNQGTLQVYEIDRPESESPVLVYLDVENYQYPQAPQGFKCPQPFNLPPP